MSYQFTKLFSSITDSTVWGESSDVRIVWITLLAMADRDGMVHASVPGLAHEARVPLAATRDALRIFQEPDPDSRTKDHEGRRIAEIDGGWVLLNHAKYRALRDADERRAYKAKKERERREKLRKEGKLNKTNISRGQERGQRGQKWTGVDIIAEADADTEAKDLKTLSREAVHANSTVQPGQEPKSCEGESSPKGSLVVFPAGSELTNLATMVVLATPWAQSRQWTEHNVTKAHRDAVFAAAKSDALFNGMSQGEALHRLRYIVEEQASAIGEGEEVKFGGNIQTYFANKNYNAAPQAITGEDNGKLTRSQRTRNATFAAIRSELAPQGTGGNGSALTRSGDGRGGNTGLLGLLAKLH